MQRQSVSRITVLQFWEAAQQSSQLAGFQKLLIAFVPAAEFEKFASHALAGGATLVVAYPNVLLDVFIGERGDNNLSLLVVLDQSNSHELNKGQQKLLPVVIAAMLKLLRAPQIVEFSDADLVSSECISQLRQVKGDSVHVRSAVERIRSGPFDLSPLDLAIVSNLKKMFVRAAIPMQVDSRIDPCSTPSQPTQETIIVPPDKVFFFSERGLFDAPPPIDPADRRELRKHIINLDFGKFSTAGAFSSSTQDVKALFNQHLKDWIATQEKDLPVRIVLYAHGGLTTEAWGLYTAAFQMKWWKQNGVYPIFFVWETGLVETLRQIFVDGQRRLPFEGTRGAISDWFDELEDCGWEMATRRLGGPKLWGGMKESARSTFADGGDGRVVLENLRLFAEEFKDRVEIHAVGHSAGSIFLSYAMQAAAAMSLPKCESMHFLAPAITCQLFRDTLMPLVGNGASNMVNSLSVFTMSDEYERQDRVGPYDKSLLYLIYNALEPQAETPLLGLERALTGDADMAKFFGLAGNCKNASTDVVFAATSADTEPKMSRSLSKAHGDFDNDPATMESVLRRITKTRNSSNVHPFPVNRSLANAARMMPLSMGEAIPAAVTPLVINNGSNSPCQVTGGGQRLALCIGINDYAAKPLQGCVNDSNSWCNWLQSQGFNVNRLNDAQATRAAISDTIKRMFDQSSPGDVIAIQYAGHGTQVPDFNGDEAQGDTPGKDEALVPFDYLQNGLVLDDDLGEMCRNIKTGVNVTFFMDCCNSGTNTRMFMSNSRAFASNQRARFMPATTEMLAAHERSRNSRALGMRAFNSPYKGTREILFAACRSNESASETDGHGDFTRNAMEVLSKRRAMTVEEFYGAVLQRFGSSPGQTPGLWCDDGLRSVSLLGKVPAS